ncbi:11433_t:CDS:2, partial [Dentiscutata erythropus]
DVTLQECFIYNMFLMKCGLPSKIIRKFLHIADLHVDPYYLELSDPTSFCHHYSPNSILNIAGNIDLIVYTGDSVRHDKDKSFKRTEEQVLDGHGR